MHRLLHATALISGTILAGVLAAGNGKYVESGAAKDSAPAIFPVASVTVLEDDASSIPPSPHNPQRKKEMRAPALLPIVDRDDIQKDDQVLIGSVLRYLPPLCRNNLENLVVRYDAEAERGQSTSHTMLLRGGMPRKEMIAVLVHECGHIIDLGGLRGSPDTDESVYPDGMVPTYEDDPSVAFYQISWQNSTKLRADSLREDFVSGYAKTDPWEDLAESFAYYILHEQSFRDRATVNEALAAKLAWMETNVIGVKFHTPPSMVWDGEIVWDVTKLPHQLAL